MSTDRADIERRARDFLSACSSDDSHIDAESVWVHARTIALLVAERDRALEDAADAVRAELDRNPVEWCEAREAFEDALMAVHRLREKKGGE